MASHSADTPVRTPCYTCILLLEYSLEDVVIFSYVSATQEKTDSMCEIRVRDNADGEGVYCLKQRTHVHKCNTWEEISAPPSAGYMTFKTELAGPSQTMVVTVKLCVVTCHRMQEVRGNRKSRCFRK